MTDLLTKPHEVLDAPVPAFGRADANLHFRSYIQERGGLGSGLFDEDERRVEVFEFTFPESSGMVYSWTDSMSGEVKTRPLSITTTDFHYDVGSMTNQWLLKPENRDTPPYNWLKENARALNAARRYWRAVAKAEQVADLERRIRDLQERVEREKIALDLAIIEVREGRSIHGDERLRLAKEYGALDEDLA